MIKFSLLLLSLLALTACVAPAPQARIKITGGEKVVVNLRDGTVEGSESKLVKVGIARLMMNVQNKNGIYDFGLIFSAGAVPTDIKIEDVTDEKSVVLMQDDKPVLDPQHRWRKTSDPVDVEIESMKWLHDIDDSFRVYRFVITFQDGQKLTLHHAAIYLAYFKIGFMEAMKPPAKP